MTERERDTFGDLAIAALQKVRKSPLIMRHRRRQISFGIWRASFVPSPDTLPPHAMTGAAGDEDIQNFCDKHRFVNRGRRRKERRKACGSRVLSSFDCPCVCEVRGQPTNDIQSTQSIAVCISIGKNQPHDHSSSCSAVRTLVQRCRFSPRIHVPRPTPDLRLILNDFGIITAAAVSPPPSLFSS